MLLLNALAKKPVDRPPIWIMRQAGRYLPEYRKLRQEAGGFMTMCQTPALAAEITLQPIRRFGFDAAIIFSDILTIPDAMGLGLHFVPGKGPQFASPLDSHDAIKRLGVIDPIDELAYVMDAIRQVKPALTVPLIGFSGSPWTLAAYMVEGHSVPGFPKLMALKEESPKVLHHLLQTLAQSVTEYLKAQIEAGADVVKLFDTWGGLLNDQDYQEFSLAPMQQIVASLKSDPKTAKTPIIMFTKGGGAWLEQMAETGVDGLAIDWTCALAEAKRRVGDRVCLQGNLNPAVLKEQDDVIVQKAQSLLAQYKGESGYIFNLGHGITPDIHPEKVKLLVETVQRYGQS